jgi:SRSO17 transposase
MAAMLDPKHVSACHQSMHHLIANAPWDENDLIRIAREQVLEPMIRHGGVRAWILDDTGIPKKGKHSVGVARQYCGKLGKRDNCQTIVSISIANKNVSVPSAHRLYLPESWIKDPERCRKAGIPEDITFQTKWQIALELMEMMMKNGIPQAPVIADAGYGRVTEFRDQLTRQGIPYVVGLKKEASVWPPGKGPLPPINNHGKGRKAKRLRRDDNHRPVSVASLAESLPWSQWKIVTWREGTKGKKRSRFATLRVRPAHRDMKRTMPRPIEWLLMEWPESEKKPTKYWLSTMPEGIPIKELVRLAMMRWRIERDYEEMKQEFGLEHYEGRGWRGLHHHITLSIVVYAFFAAERARFSPLEARTFFQIPQVPENYRPRGSTSSF